MSKLISKFELIFSVPRNIIMLSSRHILSVRILLVVFFLIFGPGSLFSQKGDDKRSKKDKTLEEQANMYFATEKFKLAEQSYRELLQRDPENFLALYRTAKCNQFLKRNEEAINWFKEAYRVDPNKNDTIFFHLGYLYKTMMNYDSAKYYYTRFLSVWPNQNDEYGTQAAKEIQASDYALKELQKDPKFAVRNLKFNSSSIDIFPSFWLYNRDTTIVFTSHRVGSTGSKEYQGLDVDAYSDLWMVKRTPKGTFTEPLLLPGAVNSKLNEGTSCFTPDGKKMYFSICGGENCSIYEALYNAETREWGEPKLTPGINGRRETLQDGRGKVLSNNTYDKDPFLSADGKVMFFTSDREGGYGKLDIWYSLKDGEGWSRPINAGPKINTPFSELKPSMGRDGALYFASNGLLGFGGYDIYKAKGDLGKWSAPENIGIPINSSSDDVGLLWTIEGMAGYFSSNRNGGVGQFDIYDFSLIPEPIYKVTVHGQIRDKNTKVQIPFATAILFEDDGKGSITPLDTFRTDQNGVYNFTLAVGKSYIVMGNAKEYLANEVAFNTYNINRDTDLEFDIDVLLERIELDKPIVLQNIYYDFDKADLRPESVTELDRLVKIMRDNPQITIEIGSHTDTNGTEQYNIELSQRRAKSVVDYLLAKMVAKDRLTYFGFGESKPLIYPEMSDMDEQINRRTEFRIKSFDYIPRVGMP
jgi:peptidoglycan-associated lipoprotein